MIFKKMKNFSFFLENFLKILYNFDCYFKIIGQMSSF